MALWLYKKIYAERFRDKMWNLQHTLRKYSKYIHKSTKVEAEGHFPAEWPQASCSTPLGQCVQVWRGITVATSQGCCGGARSRYPSTSYLPVFLGFPGGSVVKTLPANAGEKKKKKFYKLYCWRLSRNAHAQLNEHSQSKHNSTSNIQIKKYKMVEKEMATHSSILAWKIPWPGEPGGLQSIGSQRASHD